MGDLRGSQYEDQPQSRHDMSFEPMLRASIEELSKRLYGLEPIYIERGTSKMFEQLAGLIRLVEPAKNSATDAEVLRNVQINARFEVTSGDITGMTDADVKRVEFEDDGSLTVVIDHWPIEPKVFP